MMIHKFLIAAALFTSVAQAQTIDYSDVGVIVNDNSPESLEIAHYFQTARNIPSQNMIYISVTPSEEISLTGLNLIRDAVINHLLNNNLVNQIDYLVTTKGVPLRTTDASCSPGSGPCAGIESELALLKGSYFSEIGVAGQPANPYYGSDVHIADTSLDIYLVTRLDGYSVAAVKDLIDRSGPNVPINDLTANVVVDISHTSSSVEQTTFEAYYEPAYQWANTNGWNSTYHPDTSRLTNQTNVVAYASITQASQTQDINFEFVDGSIAEVVNAYEMVSFNQNNATGEDLPDFIQKGLTGGHSYVLPIYASFMLSPDLLMERYLDSANHYNLAESFYMAEKVLSYMGVIVGDPKTSVSWDSYAAVSELNNAQIQVYPNPTSGELIIQTEDQVIEQLYLTDSRGRTIGIPVKKSEGFENTISIGDHSAGVYLLHIQTALGTTVKRVVLR